MFCIKIHVYVKRESQTHYRGFGLEGLTVQGGAFLPISLL